MSRSASAAPGSPATVEKRRNASVFLPIAEKSFAFEYLEMSLVMVSVPKAPEPLYCSGIRLWLVRTDRGECDRSRRLASARACSLRPRRDKWHDGKVFRNASRKRIMREIEDS